MHCEMDGIYVSFKPRLVSGNHQGSSTLPLCTDSGNHLEITWGPGTAVHLPGVQGTGPWCQSPGGLQVARSAARSPETLKRGAAYFLPKNNFAGRHAPPFPLLRACSEGSPVTSRSGRNPGIRSAWSTAKSSKPLKSVTACFATERS